MVSKKEFEWVLIFSLFVIVFTTLPYWMGFNLQNDRYVFTGFVFGVEDGNSYIAKMLSGAHGEILFKTPYTAFEQTGFLSFMPYILLGKLTSNPGQHDQLVALFNIFRWVGIILANIATYYFSALFIQQTFHRKLVLILGALGGGLGWWLPFFTQEMPLELYSPETFGFLSYFGLPHLLVSRALLFFGIIVYLKWDNRKKKVLAVSGLWILMGFFQPLTMVVGWCVLIGYELIKGIKKVLFEHRSDFQLIIKDWGTLLMIGIVTSPWVFYNFFAMQNDPYLKGWYQQNIILSPSPWIYFASFGVFLPLLFVGGKRIFQEESENHLILLSWVLIFPILVYLPTNVQRRMAEGIWIVILLVSAIALIRLRGSKWWLVLGSAPLIMSTLILFSGAFSSIYSLNEPLFIPKNEVKLFDYINRNAEDGDVVLAAYETSNPLPAWAFVKVLAGHGPESINLKNVQLDVETFYKCDFYKQGEIIKKYQVNYVVYGINEKKLGKNCYENRQNFSHVYENSDYSLYKVNR